MAPYKERYERFLHTGNPATDMGNAILLHSEGDGSQLPSLFAVENAEEIAAKAAAEAMAAAQQQTTPMPGMGGMQQPYAQQPYAQPQTAPQPMTAGPGVPPPAPGACVPPPVMPPQEPEISLFLAINGQQYGPYNREMCKQMVQNKQLTPQTTVWMEGMPAWTPAGQVPALMSLFAPPAAAPGMPPMPPMGGPTPPPMM